MTTDSQVYTPANGQQPAPQAPAPQPQVTALSFAEKASIRLNLETVPGFEAMQRCASALASSDVVPTVYQGKVGNCFVALDIALRLRMSPVLVMQNLYLVKGKASWSGSFQTAVVNNSGLFTPLDWEWKGRKDTDDWGCRAHARRLSDGKVLLGTWVDWRMVVGEGWFGKDGSKWRTMPEQMFIYRSASFWLKAYYPEGLAGLPTAEEVEDVTAREAAPAASAPTVPAARPAQAQVVDAEVVTSPAPAAAPAPVPAKEPPPAAKPRGAAAVKAAIAERKAPPPVEQPKKEEPKAAAPTAPPAPQQGPSAEDIAELDREAEAEMGAAAAPPAGFAKVEDDSLAPGKDPVAMEKKPCSTCSDHGKPGGCPVCGVVAAAAPARQDPTHEQMVAWAKEHFTQLDKLPRTATGDVMRQFGVSFNRANAVINEIRIRK